MKRFILIFFVLHFSFFFFDSYSQPIYEFRGVWIATVDNIDWPLRGMYDTYSQKKNSSGSLICIRATA